MNESPGTNGTNPIDAYDGAGGSATFDPVTGSTGGDTAWLIAATPVAETPTTVVEVVEWPDASALPGAVGTGAALTATAVDPSAPPPPHPANIQHTSSDGNIDSGLISKSFNDYPCCCLMRPHFLSRCVDRQVGAGGLETLALARLLGPALAFSAQCSKA
ncbi:MAG: hypothetical protein ABIN96_14105 [Rubrivivax sp.]